MPSFSPNQVDREHSPLLSDVNNSSEQTPPKEETETKSSSSYFSPTSVATALTGVALAVTAFFSAPIAIAASFALALTYGATQLFNYFTTDATAQTGTKIEAQSNTPDAESDAENKKSPSRSSSYSELDKLPAVKNPEEETKSAQQTTTPVSEPGEQRSEEPVVSRQRSDSQSSTPSHSM